jgi:hypothetical protein
MEVAAWNNGGEQYGVRVGKDNRSQYFNPSWPQIEVEIDGRTHSFDLTPGFWKDCPEFRDSGTAAIRDWLRKHHALNWPKGQPPRYQLVPLGGKRFRLTD